MTAIKRYLPLYPQVSGWKHSLVHWVFAQKRFNLFSKLDAKKYVKEVFEEEMDLARQGLANRPNRQFYGMYEITIKRLGKDEVWGRKYAPNDGE